MQLREYVAVGCRRSSRRFAQPALLCHFPMQIDRIDIETVGPCRDAIREKDAAEERLIGKRS
jgi:hypothetical protein